MSTFKINGIKKSVYFTTLFVAVATLLLSTQVTANDKIVTQETLLDRIKIEDMIARYYFDLPLGKGHNLSQYYTEDAYLDVNGMMIAKGREAIEKLYSDNTEESNRSGKLHVLLNNAIISVNGDTATAWCLWTEIMNDDITKPARLLHMGREYDELVKIKGQWYFKKRYITSDSGIDEKYVKDYKPRQFR